MTDSQWTIGSDGAGAGGGVVRQGATAQTPHEGGRLSEGPLAEGRYPRCPLHLYQFHPRTGAALDVECEPATVYPIEEQGDRAVIRGVPRR